MDCTGGKAASLAAIFLLLAVAGGCAGDKKALKEPLPEKWGALAEKSQGYSPAPRPRGSNVTEFRSREEASATRLPAVVTSLTMRNTDVNIILRALARSADVNMVVSDNAKGVLTVDFASLPWDAVFRSVLNTAGLVYEWEGEILRVMTVDDMEKALKAGSVQERRKAQELSEKAVKPLTTVMIAIDYADAALLKDSLPEFLSKDRDGKPRGSIRVDEHSNSLVIQAIRDDIDRMVPLIEKIDKPTPQILIKANIVETSKDVARNLGVQWGGLLKSASAKGAELSVSPGNRDFAVDFPVSEAAIAGAGGVGALGLTYGTVGGNLLDLQLQALQKDGKLNIVSSPSIITIDNQKAFTESGERVPYVSTASSTGGVTQEVKFIDAVLRLEIIPHVIDGTNLKMKVIVKKDEVDVTRSVQGNPFIIKKNTETTLIVKDGETIVISGLTRQRDADTVSGVPGLRNIPLLGWLFRSNARSNAMEEVLIFVTPHILPPQAVEVGMRD